MGVSLQTLVFILLSRYLETLLWGYLQVGGGIGIYDTHALNTVHTLLHEVSDENVFLLLQVLCYLVLKNCYN